MEAEASFLNVRHRAPAAAVIGAALLLGIVSSCGRAEVSGAQAKQSIVLRLVDREGKPVAGAHTGRYARTLEPAVLGRSVLVSQPTVSEQDGRVVLQPEGLDDKTALYILHEERRLAAFCNVSDQDAGTEKRITLEPACRLYGRLGSRNLQEIGWPLDWTNVYLYRNDDRPLSHGSERQQMEFWVPAGTYRLHAYGSAKYSDSAGMVIFSANTQSVNHTVTVKAGQSELDVGTIDLPPDRLAGLIGRPAPELRQIKGWKNGAPVTLAELRGKVVLLDFWGYWCVPCILAMPKLMALHDAFGDKGLVVLAVHNDRAASIEEMDAKLARAREQFWGGRDLPFLVALDGGGRVAIEGTDGQADGATTAAYGIRSFPSAVLIDREGIVCGRINVRAAKEMLGELLGLAAPPVQAPAWKKRFDRVYHLDEGQVLKRIVPPFIPERMDHYRSNDPTQAQMIPRGPDRLVFHWDGTLKPWGMHFGTPSSLDDVLTDVLQLKTFEYDGPARLLDLELPGDWIVRDELPQKVKLHALESLLAGQTGRKIRFERRRVERKVIIATGKFKFHPPVGTYENTSVHLYADVADPDERSGGGTADSLHDFLLHLGSRVDMPVIDRTEPVEPMRIPYRQHGSSQLRGVEDEREKDRKLSLLLKNLTQQTELHFEIRTQPVALWYVTEQQDS